MTDPSASASAVLYRAAESIGRSSSDVAPYASVLAAHWFETAADLRVAAADEGSAWLTLPLPGRLKLAMKLLVLGGEEGRRRPRHGGQRWEEGETADEAEDLGLWERVLDAEAGWFFYRHLETGESHWEAAAEEEEEEEEWGEPAAVVAAAEEPKEPSSS